jgi:hypothetical protein
LKVGDLVRITRPVAAGGTRQVPGLIIDDMYAGPQRDRGEEVLVLIDYLGKGHPEEFWFRCGHLEVISESR